MLFRPIAETEIFWDTYRDLTCQALGRSLFDVYNDRGLVASEGHDSFLGTLAAIKNPKANPIILDTDMTKHLHFVVLIVDTCRSIFALLSELNMPFTVAPTKEPDYYLAIVSGTLQQWRSVSGPPKLKEEIARWLPM